MLRDTKHFFQKICKKLKIQDTMIQRLFIIIALVSVVSVEQCYWNSAPYIYFGGKTLYDDVRGDIRNATKLTGCEPVSIWILCRHGARNPSESNIQGMKNGITLKEDILRNHAQGLGELCDKDISDLKAWKWNETIDTTPYFLTSRGYRELREIGGRINEKFYNLLINLPVHYIRPTNEQRTIESAKSFLNGLDPNLGYTIQDPIDKDLMLMSFRNCELHQNVSWNGPRLPFELDKYYRTADYEQLSENLQRRAGFVEPLTITNISDMYELCRFYRAYSETARSPWCALFSNQDFEVMEYIQDIRHHFRSGYGIPINKNLGELVLSDLLKKFQEAVYSSRPSFTAYFSHDSLIDMVYGALGLFRDEEGITAENRNPRRKWRTSINTPFAANIVAILYNCKEPCNVNPYKVQFFANERSLNLCDDETCSWTQFEDKLKPFENSNLDFCNIKSN